MAGTSQPHVLSVIVSSFGDFTASHGFAVNLFAVIVLAGLGTVFCASAVRGDARLARIGVVAGAVFCLADWVLIEDLGFLGGLGTDPNSMIPLILMFTAGWLALTPAPREEPATAPADAVSASVAGAAAAVPAVSAVGSATATAQGQEATVQAVAGTAAQQATASTVGTPAPGPSADPRKAWNPSSGQRRKPPRPRPPRRTQAVPVRPRRSRRPRQHRAPSRPGFPPGSIRSGCASRSPRRAVGRRSHSARSG